jgi:hypothetical protein
VHHRNIPYFGLSETLEIKQSKFDGSLEWLPEGTSSIPITLSQHLVENL